MHACANHTVESGFRVWLFAAFTFALFRIWRAIEVALRVL